jgi:predicted HTH transcriptional regulator
VESKEVESNQKGIGDLLKLPESEILEFKSTLKWDIRQEKSNPELVMGCVKTIAGFLNNSGGILIVGYDDDNNIVYGLEKDYPFTSKKCNYDGWQQYFINQVNDKLGKTINHYFTIESISYDGKTLAKINVKSSPEPVFTRQDNNEGNFYVRIHGQTENLNPQETQKWISSHFKK